jgi:hypothetical protein
MAPTRLLDRSDRKERQMIEYELDTENSILYVQPKSAIEQDDFTKIAKAVDPHIEATGDLAGVIIGAKGFPGWDSLGAMVNHFVSSGTTISM